MGCPAMALALPQATFFERNTEQLGITQEQLGKLKDVIAKSDEALRPLLQKSGDAIQALRAGAFAPQYDAEKVKGLAAAAEKAEADVVTARLAAWAKVREVLTADQVTKLRDLMASRRGFGGGTGPAPGAPGAPPPSNGPAPAPPPQQ